jgi:hypothetical protein
MNKHNPTKFSWADSCEDENNYILTDSTLESSVLEESEKKDEVIEKNYEEIVNDYVKKEIDYNKTKFSSHTVSNFVPVQKMEARKNGWNISNNRKKKEKNKCFTCFPERKVKKHIILPHIDDNVSFHHDMWNRNMIIATPNNHYHTISDFPQEELSLFFRTITQFCENWNLTDYNVSYNHGDWQTHHHFHAKIKILDKIANRMRGDFFRIQKLQNNYNKKEA